MFPLVLIGVGLLFLAAAGAKKRPPAESGELPPELATMFELIGGQLVYRPEMAASVIRSLHYKAATPPPDGAPNVVIVSPGPGTPLGPDEWGAYHGIKGLHSQGFDIWVPHIFHLPVATPHAVAYLPPGEAEQAKYAGYAKLIGAAHTWPESTP